MATPAAVIEDALFQQVLGESASAVEHAVTAQELVGQTPLSVVTDRLAGVFAASKADTRKILGVSRSKVSRNPKMNLEILDRAGSALKLFARVVAMIGDETAAGWLNKSNHHLGGKRPVDLRTSNIGRGAVRGVVVGPAVLRYESARWVPGGGRFFGRFRSRRSGGGHGGIV